MSAELLDVEQLDVEIVEGVSALVHSLEQSLGAAIGLDGGPDDARRELISLGHRVKAIGVGSADTAASDAKAQLPVRRLEKRLTGVRAARVLFPGVRPGPRADVPA